VLQGASHPEWAIDEWIRVLRPGGRLVVDSRADASALPEPLDNARKSPEYAAIGDRLRFLGGTFEGEPQLLRCKKRCCRSVQAARFLTGPKNRLSRARVTRPAISRFLAR